MAAFWRERESGHAFNPWRDYRGRIELAGMIHMLLLSAILRVWLPREPQPNDLLAEARLRIGHVGLTVVALVFVLLNLWQS